MKILSMEAINSVTKAEAEAEKLVQQARNDARDLLVRAREQAAGASDQAVKAAAEHVREQAEQAAEEGRRAGTRVRAETADRCKALRAEAERNMDAAVKLIVERVVNN